MNRMGLLTELGRMWEEMVMAKFAIPFAIISSAIHIIMRQVCDQIKSNVNSEYSAAGGN
jgi:hypothetical protein